MFSDADEYDGQKGHLADPCILISHPEGWLLWDTGIADDTAKHPIGNSFARMARSQTLVEELAALHLTPADIKYLGLSHVHADHTGNANLFTHSAWLMQEKELNYALAKPTPLGIEPATLSAQKTVKKNLLHGDLDVFGDGRVRIFSTPGHTPGHQSLMVQLKDEGYVIFSGDLFHIRENLEQKRVPVYNTSRAETLASMDRVERLAKTYHARVVVQHDAGDFGKLPKFPAFLK